MNRTENEPNETIVFDLGNGDQFTFAPLVAWDLLKVKSELGSSIKEADPLESSLALAWRSAVNGGFEGDLEDFCKAIPLDRLNELTEAIRPMMGKHGESPDQGS